jgi:RimJ/RimL family protein N-acetyltransferase
MKTFIGTRIYLRPMTEADATERYASWLNDPEVNKFLATKSATVPELREYIAAKNAQAGTLFFGIFLQEDDMHIGTIKLEPIDRVNKKATIAIMIGDKQQWGKGIAKEAMSLLIDYCFSDLQFKEVNLGVLAQNEGAVRAYTKLGFKEVSREVGSVHFPNGIFDQITMTMQNHA